MNLDWYHCFIVAVLVLWLIASPRDRNALRIVLIASLISEVIVSAITKQIHAPWKLAITGATDVLTIAALCQWSKNQTGHLQIGCLCFSWFAGMLCYIDVCLKTDFIYSRYEETIQLVALAQLLAFHDTLVNACTAFYRWAFPFRGAGHRCVAAASVSHNLLRDQDGAIRTKIL